MTWIVPPRIRVLYRPPERLPEHRGPYDPPAPAEAFMPTTDDIEECPFPPRDPCRRCGVREAVDDGWCPRCEHVSSEEERE